MQDFRRERHSVSRLTVQLVCVTKYRRKVFDAGALEWLQGHFAKVCETMGCDLLACDGEADHLHAIIEYPPKVSISALVNALKGTSSRLLRPSIPSKSCAAGCRTSWPTTRHLACHPARLPHPEPDPRHATPPCSMPIGQPTLGRLNSAAGCLIIRTHYTLVLLAVTVWN
jgi:REP element-mobilizing transposase RayT